MKQDNRLFLPVTIYRLYLCLFYFFIEQGREACVRAELRLGKR
jgi:hypothetical protein